MPDSSGIALEDCVLAVIPAESSAELLDTIGSDPAVLLTHVSDMERFTVNRGGVAGALNRITAALGDEGRVLETLEQALADGSHVILAPVTDEDDAAAISERLKRSGAGPIWHFGKWSFTSTGPDEATVPLT